MSNISSNIAAIRQRLGNPNPHAPSDVMLLNYLIDQLLHHQAQLQNTRQHWGIESFTLTTQPDVEDYAITAQNFGRPFLVHTQDSTDPFHRRVEIPFSLMQDADQRYWGPQRSNSVYKWSAVEMVFYRQGTAQPAWRVRPVPIPNSSGEYRVWYEMNYDFGALDDKPGLECFHHLVRVQTAISALPDCAWGMISIEKAPKLWEVKVKAKRDALLHDEAIFQKQFDRYITMGTRDGVLAKIGYGADYENEWYPNTGRMIPDWGI